MSRSPSISSQYGYSTDSGSEIDAPPKQTQSIPLVPIQTATPRCILTAKFELELDPNVMNAATAAAVATPATVPASVSASVPMQPYVHKSSSKPHHNNRQPKRHKRYHNTKY